MAAYAALVSVMHLIDQLQLHPYPPVSLDPKQVESLTEKVTFLQEFLEEYFHVGYSDEAVDLESRIADAAHAVEDVIESHIVDQILRGSTSHGENTSSIEFYNGLQKVIEDVDSIKTEVMKIKEKMEGVQNQLHKDSSSVSAGSSRFPSTGQNRTTVGFDDVLREMMDDLTGGQLDLHIIPITGMGGIGKTTLARNIYENQVVVEYFDVLAWATISQEHKMKEILLALLGEDRDDNESELGVKLYQHLFGRRYLIIIDDIWDILVWEKMKSFFPNNNNGSRIMVTTRQSDLASQITRCHSLEMKLLGDDASWDLFCKTVFGKEECPPELGEIGKGIAKDCRGLPLSLVVIGGLLAKSEKTQKYWEQVSKNLNSIVNLENDGHCLKILYMSYSCLPVHLKPCFLYMGVYPEDSEILASRLIKIWVAEGFLKPIVGKSLEDVGELYLKELIDRNLILHPKYNSLGKIKAFIVHDLIRDLCVREAGRQKFFWVPNGLRHTPRSVNRIRRIFVERKNYHYKLERDHDDDESKKNVSAIRVFWRERMSDFSIPISFRLLRIATVTTPSLEPVFQKVNLRYLWVIAMYRPVTGFASLLPLLWNLQTLIVSRQDHIIVVPSEIWKMPLLRHVQVNKLYLPDPPNGHIILENLQTLSRVFEFKFDGKVVKRIPNIKKLNVYYPIKREEEHPIYWFTSLNNLRKLESFRCHCEYDKTLIFYMRQLTFPRSLKKLTLYGTHFYWEDMTTKIDSLPLLQVLKLGGHSFTGYNWKTIEGRFCSLKFLLISNCDLEYWTTDSTHFPRLEHLILEDLYKLKEIPSSIGDIPTLQSIKMARCPNSAHDSARRILEQQEELGNDSLEVQIGESRESAWLSKTSSTRASSGG